MQHFITDQFSIQGKNISISDERVLYQCTKVLRYKAWDVIIIQSNNTRYEVSIEWRDKKALTWTIEKVTSYQLPATSAERLGTESRRPEALIVAMTNKRDKMELICQKATEIWISHIIIWTSKRSVIQTIADNKLDRLKLICLEAAEQSFNRTMPEITICRKIQDLPKSYVAYQDWIAYKQVTPNSLLLTPNLIVGPEGWFESTEINYFKQNNFPFVKLGDTVFRTETAAIIWAWWLKNL